MKLAELLEIVDDEPVFETGLLLAGDEDPRDIRRQLSRWARDGKVHRLRRGLYALAPPYRKRQPHPFVVANRLVPGSYVSAQSALAHGGFVPEYAQVTTSVSTGRPARWQTPLGSFEFRHLKVDLFWGYTRESLAGGEPAFLATLEKALLDLVHLEPGADSRDYLRELRLQNLERLDIDRLHSMARRTGSPKLRRAARNIQRLAAEEALEYETG